jgi:hypothetical protein
LSFFRDKFPKKTKVFQTVSPLPENHNFQSVINLPRPARAIRVSIMIFWRNKMYNQIALVGMGTQGVEIVNELIEEGIDIQTFAIHDHAKGLEKSQADVQVLLSVDEQNIEDRFIELTSQIKIMKLVILVGNLGSSLAHHMKTFVETVYGSKVLGIIPKDKDQRLQDFQLLLTAVCSSFFKFHVNSIIEELGDSSELEIKKLTNFYIKSMVEMLTNIERYGFLEGDSDEVQKNSD